MYVILKFNEVFNCITYIQKGSFCIFHRNTSLTKPPFLKDWQLEGPQVKM